MQIPISTLFKKNIGSLLLTLISICIALFVILVIVVKKDNQFRNYVHLTEIEIQSLKDQIKVLREFRDNTIASKMGTPKPSEIGQKRRAEYDELKQANRYQITCINPSLAKSKVPEHLFSYYIKYKLQLFCENSANNQSFIIISEVKDRNEMYKVLYAVLDTLTGQITAQKEIESDTNENHFSLHAWVKNSKIYFFNIGLSQRFGFSSYPYKRLNIFDLTNNTIESSINDLDTLGRLIFNTHTDCEYDPNNEYVIDNSGQCYQACNYDADCLTELGEKCMAINSSELGVLKAKLVCKVSN